MIAPNLGSHVKTTWEAEKAKLKSRFPKLTDEDLNYEERSKDEMLAKLEMKLSIPAKELEVILKSF